MISNNMLVVCGLQEIQSRTKARLPCGGSLLSFRTTFDRSEPSKPIICLWKNGRLNSAIRPVERGNLVDILSDWVEPK